MLGGWRVRELGWAGGWASVRAYGCLRYWACSWSPFCESNLSPVTEGKLRLTTGKSMAHRPKVAGTGRVE